MAKRQSSISDSLKKLDKTTQKDEQHSISSTEENTSESEKAHDSTSTSTHDEAETRSTDKGVNSTLTTECETSTYKGKYN